MAGKPFSDEDAIELLDKLADYYESTDFDPLDPKKCTVSELAGDLLDSLARGLITRNYSCLKPDALTARSHYRTS